MPRTKSTAARSTGSCATSSARAYPVHPDRRARAAGHAADPQPRLERAAADRPLYTQSATWSRIARSTAGSTAASSSRSSTNGSAATSAGLRPDVRRRARQLVGEPPSSACTRETCGRASRSSTTGTFTPATTSSSPATCSATSRDGTCSSWSLAATASFRARQAGPLPSDAGSATCASPATAAARRIASRPPGGRTRSSLPLPGYKAFFHHVDRPMRMMSGTAVGGPGARGARGRLRRGGCEARSQRSVHRAAPAANGNAATEPRRRWPSELLRLRSLQDLGLRGGELLVRKRA